MLKIVKTSFQQFLSSYEDFETKFKQEKRYTLKRDLLDKLHDLSNTVAKVARCVVLGLLHLAIRRFSISLNVVTNLVGVVLRRTARSASVVAAHSQPREKVAQLRAGGGQTRRTRGRQAGHGAEQSGAR